MWGFTKFRLALLLLVIASYDIRLANGFSGGTKGGPNPSDWYYGSSDVDKPSNTATAQMPGTGSMGSFQSGYRQPSTSFESVSYLGSGNQAYQPAPQPVVSSQSGATGSESQLSTGQRAYQNLDQFKDAYKLSGYGRVNVNPVQAGGPTGQSNFQPLQTPPSQGGLNYNQAQTNLNPVSIAKPTGYELASALATAEGGKSQSQSHFSPSRGAFQSFGQPSAPPETTYKPVRQNQQSSWISWKPQSSGSPDTMYSPFQENQNEAVSGWKPPSSGSSQATYNPLPSRPLGGSQEPAAPVQRWEPQSPSSSSQGYSLFSPQGSLSPRSFPSSNMPAQSSNPSQSRYTPTQNRHHQSPSVSSGRLAPRSQQTSKPDRDGYQSRYPAKPVQRWQQPSSQASVKPEQSQQMSRPAQGNFQSSSPRSVTPYTDDSRNPLAKPEESLIQRWLTRNGKLSGDRPAQGTYQTSPSGSQFVSNPTSSYKPASPVSGVRSGVSQVEGVSSGVGREQGNWPVFQSEPDPVQASFSRVEVSRVASNTRPLQSSGHGAFYGQASNSLSYLGQTKG